MKRRLLTILSLLAIIVFLGLQIYLVINIRKQKAEQLTLRYTILSREAFNSLIKRTGNNGFEKPMGILDIFSELIKQKELPLCRSRQDTLVVARQAMKEAASIIRKNESLTSFIRQYISESGYDTAFIAEIKIRRFVIFSSGIDLSNPESADKTDNLVFINSFREERNNFSIDYDLFLNLKQRNQIVFRETLLSLTLITASLIVVLLIYWLTLKNLMEERRLSDLKSDFINNMTHELKTPLSTITVAGRMLELEQISTNEDKVKETARMIGKQSIHLNQLINTILDVSLLEREQFSLDPRPVRTDELLHEITEAFLTSCDNKVKLEEDLNCSQTIAEIDILYFTTMINNLLSNAVRYCDKEPVIRVSSAENEKSLIITVADNGTGISKEHIGHIFDKFYRVPQGNIHKVKGLGLGLYYVKCIAIAHGGNVSVTSKPGRSTTFVINLPKKQQSHEDTDC